MRDLLFITLLMFSAFSFAEVYKWVDKDGKVHFGDGEPEGESSERITVKATKPSTLKSEGFDRRLLIGTWETKMAGSIYVKYVLSEDGTYKSMRTDHGILSLLDKGTWEIDDESITWRHKDTIPKLPDSIMNTPDVNKIVSLDEKNFVIIEMSGKQSTFVKVEK